MYKLNDYRKIAGKKAIDVIREKAEPLEDKHVAHINSTYQGGGVAEILESLIPLMNDIGIDAGWRILHGNNNFFTATKKIHNALQGEEIEVNERAEKLYYETNENFSIYTHIDHDCVIVHDPQPLPLIKFYKKTQPWIWRCHIDLSDAYQNIWQFLLKYIRYYDHIVLSNESYKRNDIKKPQHIIFPAIDPLSLKNKELPKKRIESYLDRFDIQTDKPIIGQVSRFDKWKDPSGVIDIFKEVKKKIDCRLVLCGSMATDDPENMKIYDQVRRKAEPLVKKGDINFITIENDRLVNVLQRTFAVTLQKSYREGFGLTVSESLWKGTPVVATNRGGIPLQIENGVNGFLLEPDDKKGFVEKITYLLKNPEKAKDMGLKGRETVKEKFLITRLLENHLDLLNDVLLKK